MMNFLGIFIGVFIGSVLLLCAVQFVKGIIKLFKDLYYSS